MTNLWRTVAVSVAQTAVLSALILSLAAGLHLSYNVPAMIGVAATAVLSGRVLARSSEARVAIDLSRAEVPVARPFGRFAVMRERLRWGLADRDHFSTGVRPVLVELIDDRLRRHHGIERAHQADEARAVVGERMWAMVAGAPELRPPSGAEVEAIVSDIERL